MKSLHTVSIVVPVFNEEAALQPFHRQLCAVVDTLPYEISLLYINDGSTDHTQEILRQIAESDRRVQVIELSRNFGHQAALTAGLDLAEGEVVISLDGDGQHPPDLIPQMIELYRAGYDIVLGQRVEAQAGFSFKRLTADLFYWLINRLGDTQVIPGCADFRLMSRKAVLALRQMREYHRFLRGMVPWMGFRSVILPYSPPQRLAGHSKYSLKKMMGLAADAIFSFSLVPLRIGFAIGIFFLCLAALEVVYVLSFWLRGQQASLAPGWSSLVFIILIVGGTLMINLGFIGAYIGYIFQEVKHRPVYFIRSSFPSKEQPGHE